MAFILEIDPTDEALVITAELFSKKDLVKLLICLLGGNLNRQRLIDTLRGLDVQITMGDINILDKEDIEEHFWREFLHIIKRFEYLWIDIQDTGYHQLLKEE